MKNQNVNSANGKAEFIDIKGAKNPFYQPMAGKANASTENKTTINEESKKENTLSTVKVQDAKENSDSPKSAGAMLQVPKPNLENEDPKTAEVITEKPALNLEGTLKLVEELHRRMVQRGRLVHTIDNLDKFEIEQKEEAEDTTSNYYQGCELEISDDKRNKFSTKNPVIIKAVALFVRDLCTNRLAEIEAEITIPA
ncbi:hypothetical protein [Pedobacter jeongneungensis]|uniref:hypothetical protein n=1 Tax=Pedobacter jeongneungensis TaxID=947309 RepID=UPI000468DC67|nr:hypothetical protein [Pedobacter jeongneungensis]